MKATHLALAALLGGLTLFGWETVSNTAIPWHDATIRSFTDSSAVVQAVKANAAGNGMYVDMRGVVAAVSFTPDLADRSTLVGSMIARQAALDIAIGFVLVMAFLRLPRASTKQYAWGSAVAALAVGASIFVSDWNWWGFSLPWSAINLVDRMIGYGLLGLVLGGLLNRWSPVRPTTDEWSGVQARGGIPSQLQAPTSGAKR
jgi:hypothetical protein